MRRGVVLGLVALLGAAAVAVWIAVRNAQRGYTSTHGSHVVRFTLKSKLLHRDLHEILVESPGGGRRRPLLVLLHGRSSSPDSFLSDQFFEGLEALGDRAPDVLLPDGGDHSYWHDRADGPWGAYVLTEAIPAGLRRIHSNHKMAIGGISMGGFGALDLARMGYRFCAVGGHSAALWFSGADTPAGAFDDAEDFERNDVIAAARRARTEVIPSLYRIAQVWLDVGADDPFRQADTALARALGVRIHVWPGGHEGSYWRRHIRQYLRFYADSCRTRLP